MNFSALTSNSTALYTLIGAGAFAVAAIVVGVTLAKKYPNKEHKGIHQVLAEEAKAKKTSLEK